MMNTEAKITAAFLALVLTGTPVSEALAKVEDDTVAAMVALGSTTPEHGIRFIVRETLVSAL